MDRARDWMTADLNGAGRPAGAVDVGAVGVMRAPEARDAAALARLMLDAYAGTVDDEGGTHEDAEAEVARLFGGAYGAMEWEVSRVVEDGGGGGGALAAATLVTRNTGTMKGPIGVPIGVGEAFVAFSMTAPAFKRRGLARAGLVAMMAGLRARGEARVHLVVTRGNVAAVRLYESLGFVRRG